MLPFHESQHLDYYGGYLYYTPHNNSAPAPHILWLTSHIDCASLNALLKTLSRGAGPLYLSDVTPYHKFIILFSFFMYAESKSSKSGFGGTKRRRYSSAPNATASDLSNRITRLSKSLKAANPVHLYNNSLATLFPNLSTTGTIFSLASGIQQGDSQTDRFANHIDFRRILVRGHLLPGSTSTLQTQCRISVIRGQSGLVFAGNMTASYSPILPSTSTQVLYDKFFLVSPVSAGQWQVPINITIKTKHRQKFSGAGVGTETSETLYMICQSTVASGTTAPILAGFLNLFFVP